jgi:hypothetical protein
MYPCRREFYPVFLKYFFMPGSAGSTCPDLLLYIKINSFCNLQDNNHQACAPKELFAKILTDKLSTQHCNCPQHPNKRGDIWNMLF